ncbi:endonuclease V [Flavobacterium piscinae]|uniref:Endonuclease V n=1 Tax=Flavobacterium piscinae TaxID=2506424 RepID=A0A4Q1KWN6_9FLAO|nr:endonuclease V [Flavobacterium piscinae]RXR34642.1 endonuclease V [Flavobacterium piscinae]
MIVAVDVHYKEAYAKTVLVLFEDWLDDTYTEILEVNTFEVADYEPGFFYKRELPCLLQALKKIDLKNISTIIVDGYVFTDNELKQGLGAYLYEALEQKIPVIGVAKTTFHANSETVVPVLRGESNKPLYVSAIGINKELAAEKVKAMHGEFRLPYLLKLMDQKTKEI